MRGNRTKQTNESTPSVEVKRHEHNYEIRFNFAEQPATDEYPASFNYDYVKIKKLTKKAIKIAVIKSSYPYYDDELSIINNKESGKQSDVDAYNAYQNYRTFAETVANEAIQYA